MAATVGVYAFHWLNKRAGQRQVEEVAAEAARYLQTVPPAQGPVPFDSLVSFCADAVYGAGTSRARSALSRVTAIRNELAKDSRVLFTAPPPGDGSGSKHFAQWDPRFRPQQLHQHLHQPASGYATGPPSAGSASGFASPAHTAFLGTKHTPAHFRAPGAAPLVGAAPALGGTVGNMNPYAAPAVINSTDTPNATTAKSPGLLSRLFN